MARFLLKNGVKPGDSIPVILPPSSEHPIILLALSKIGVTYIPIDPHSKCPTERINKILSEWENGQTHQ
jgi:acyl-CoA synthetase (AMP-forming)/AMP-acid ligase II